MKHLKLIFACLLMAVLSIGQVWAAEVTIEKTMNEIVTANDYTVSSGNTATCYTSFALDGNITISTSGSANCGSFWGSSTKDWRLYQNKSGNITITAASGYGLKKVTITYSVSNTGTLKDGSTTVASASEQTVSGTSKTFTVGNTGSATNGQVRVTKIKVVYEATEPSDACDAPTFSPAAGAVASGTEVTISSTDGATIYYTTDGSNPTTSSSTTQPIVITSATTIKAFAVKSGLSDSEVATAAYTILTPQTISAIMPTKTTEGAEFLLNDVTVTYVYGNNVYVKDASGYMLVYSSIAGAANGKVLQGLQGKAKLYNGLPEISTVTKAPTVTDGSAVAPEALAAYPVDGDLNKYVTLENVTFATAASFTGSVNNVTGSFDGSDLVFRNTFKLSGVSLTAGTPYRVVGIVQKFNDAYQVYPISFEEIVTETQVATPTFSPAAGTYTAVQNVSISTETTDATIYYTTNGDEPTKSSTLYEGAIEVGASKTIKAIAVKDGLDDSNVASAEYTINLPLPSHDFQVTHHFSTGEGFEFPTGWSTSYAEHEIAYTDDKVVFAGASKQNSGAKIDDRPVTKNQAISLVLTNSHKLISAVRFDYAQWDTKAQTLTMKYSTDGGANYSDFDPVVSSTAFALQVLDLPEGVNAIQVTGANSSNQVGLTSIAFDLVDKPIVTKTVTITAPAVAEGTLVVKNAGVAISSGDAIEVGTTLTIEAAPESGYLLSAVSVVDEDDDPVSVSEGAFVVPNKNVTVSATFTEVSNPATLTLSVQGTESSYPGSHNIGDEITLPNTATACEGNVFVGWSEVVIATPGAKPASQYYDKGAQYTLTAATQTLYAVYAKGDDASWTLTYTDINKLGSGTSYADYNGERTKDGISFTTSNIMVGSGDNAGKIQFKASAGLLYNSTAFDADIVSIEIDGVDLSVYEGTAEMSSTPASGAIGKSDGVYPFSSGKRYFHLKKANSGAGYAASITVHLQPEYSNYTTSCIVPVDVPEPEFDVAEGTYTTAQTVMIDNYDDDYIYVYTLDGSEPTADSNLDPLGTAVVYDDASGIEINSPCTLKARAYDIDGNYSDVTSATYTINLPLTTIPAVFAAATSTQTEVNITLGNWVVSGVGTDAKTVYVTDGTNGFIIYNESHGFEVGDILSGTITCDLKKYNGAAELIGVTTSTTDLSVTKGGVITPAVKVISALSGINTGAAVTINSVQFDGTNLSDGANYIKPYHSLFAYDALENGKYYNVTGIYLQFGGTKEILPRSAADIEELTLADPELSYTPSSLTIELGDDWTAPTLKNDHNLTLSYESSNPALATVSDAGVIELVENKTGTATITASFAGDATYAAGSATYEITVNPAGSSDNVVVLVQFNDGVDDKWLAMKHDLTAIEVNYSGGKIYDLPVENQAEITWRRTVDGEDNVTFQNPGNDDYLKGSTSTTLTVAAGKSGAYQWKWNETYYRVGTQTRTFLYQGNSAKFKNFAVSNAGGTSDGGYSQLPEVTAAAFETGSVYTTVRTGLTAGNYYTVCWPKAMTAIKGGTLWSFAGKDASMAYLIQEDAPFVAGRPYIIYATADKLEAVVEGDDAAAGSNNGLYGTLDYMDADALEAAGATYMMKNNELRPIGTNNHLDANRAYVILENISGGAPSGMPAHKVRAIPMQGTEAQGVDNLNASETPVKIMIDGQLFIIRGEKMYDATGRLVK